ncbi:MAG TPA: hypothetical protein VMT43_06985 [Acidimicrobiales bacterium]|nr:hypothetical protein [Acidimicrobiales bacterium]
MTVVDQPLTVPDGFGHDPFLEIWNRLSRPFDVVRTISALLGLPASEIAQMVGARVATSPEADALLEAMPRTVRSLATSLQTQTERCVGNLRGPVLWSETMSARASSFGDEGLFVCKTPSRAYDIDENRVLVAALLSIRDSAFVAEHNNERALDDPLLRAARRNGNEANRFVEHPSLTRVTRERPNARAVKRTRSGKHRKSYQPALDMLERMASPLDSGDVRALCDERTAAQHRVLIGLIERLEHHGGTRLPPFRVERGALFSGPVQYYHGRRLGDRTRLSGIVVGQLLVDVPDRLHDPSRRRAEARLAVRAGGRRAMVVMNEEDIDRAVEVAIELATR